MRGTWPWSSTHDDADALAAYQAHPRHLEVVGWLGPRLVLAEAVAEKFGGDSVPEICRNLTGYPEDLIIS